MILSIDKTPRTYNLDYKYIHDDNKSKEGLEIIINRDLGIITKWIAINRLIVNYDKSNFTLIGVKKMSNFEVNMNSKRLSRVEETKILGVMIDSDLSFKSHTNTLSNNTSKVVSILSKARYYLPAFSLNLIYKSLIQSKFIYAPNLWGFTYKNNVKRIELVQKRAAKTILFKKGTKMVLLFLKR